MTQSEESTDHLNPGSFTHTKIGGSIPGQLDTTQPSRLLREPRSTLSFAAFDPRAASGQQDVPDFRKLSLKDELYKPKRIVIETAPSGASFWRFVPNARKEDGVSDEGQWPRVVKICGIHVECSQEQWDIYKLDPSYNCCVRAAPHLSTITRVDVAPADSEAPHTPSKKRHASPLEDDMPPHRPHPKKRTIERTLSPISSDEQDEDEDEDEESDVEEMVIDEEERRNARRSKSVELKAKRYREKVDKERRERRERTKHRAYELRENGDRYIFNAVRIPNVGEKRKASGLETRRGWQEDPDYKQRFDNESSQTTGSAEHPKPSKRTRTVSPDTYQQDPKTRRLERERLKREKWRKDLHNRRHDMESKFMEEVYTEALDPDGNVIDPNDHEHTEEAIKNKRLAESLRKMAELERDRPLWDEAKRLREMREKAEQEAQRVKAERRKQEEARKAEAERRAKAQREEQARKEEAERRAREESARREKERRQRDSRWAGPWSSLRALDRYRALCEVFDTKKYTVDDPLSFDLVPWPSLRAPSALSVEDLDWAEVEGFFKAMQKHVRGQDYKDFVVQSHRRFHPDRWRSRGLLKTVVDEEERGCMEVALNTVAQALTPLWGDLTR